MRALLSAAILLFATGCSLEAEGDGVVAYDALPCPGGLVLVSDPPPNGRLDYCARPDGDKPMPDGPWRSYWANGKTASEGSFSEGMMQGPTAQYAADGTKTATLDGDVLVVKDEAGEVALRVPYRDGRPIPCPGTAAGQKPPEGRATWCEIAGPDGAMQKVGRQVTFYADGQVESLSFWAEGKLQGRFQAFHPDGSRWVEGEYSNGKRHGAWVTWPAGKAPGATP